MTKLHLIPYLEQQPRYPAEGRHIMAQYDAETVVVYQAFNAQVAAYAVKHQRFGGEHYSLTRMSWIKPNFLWMMHRSGWADKAGQEHILAIWLRRDSFNAILSQAVHSAYEPEVYVTTADWKAAVARSDVRLQWDPDYTPNDTQLERRAIQLGLRGEVLRAFAQGGWIMQIEDITPVVHQQRQYTKRHLYDELRVPHEEVYPVADAEIARRLQLSTDV
jgi:hypothetical protein